MSSVGLITPSYNDKPFLERMLDSLYQHTNESRYTLLVVNDGSTDGTGEWLTQMSMDYGFFLINTPNIRFTRVCNDGLR